MTQSPISYPQPIALDDLCQTTFPPTDWIIQGLLPAGLTLLAGKLRTGKSHLARQLAFSVATGQLALDKFPTTRATVLYLGLDDIPRRMVEHAQQQLHACPPPHTFFWQNSWPLLTNGGLNALETWLQQNPTTRLVVIDPLSQLHPHTQKPSQNATILSSLKRIADTYHLSILLTHHIRQSNPKDPLSALSNTPELATIPDCVMLMHPNSTDHTTTIHISGYDLEPRTLDLTFDSNDSRWTISPDSFSGYNLTPQRIDILNVLHTAGHPLSPSEIAIALNREPARISRLLYSMVRSGLVHSVETNRYVPLINPYETSSRSRLLSLIFSEPDPAPSNPDTTSSPATETSEDETSECRNAGMSECTLDDLLQFISTQNQPYTPTESPDFNPENPHGQPPFPDSPFSPPTL
jgi:hypothetical protein